MYSYTNFQEYPLLTIRCNCGRQFNQEEIYTCLGCCNYACRYCTSIELHSYYCRHCSVVASEAESSKFTHCTTCYTCPTCSHVLSVFKDPKTKQSIYLCQFCYWTSKEIGIESETAEGLSALMGKVSKGFKENDLKYYQHCQKFLKEKSLENGEVKIDLNRRQRPANNTTDMILQFRNEYLGMNPSQTGSTLVAKTVPLLDENIQYSGLNDQEEESQDFKIAKSIPKPIPLIARKTRRCLNCKKLLTKSFRTFRNEYKVQLGHNEPRMLLCQKAPVTDKVKVKSIADVECIYKPLSADPLILKNGSIFEIPVEEFGLHYGLEKAVEFFLQIELSIPNNQKKKIEYRFILQI